MLPVVPVVILSHNSYHRLIIFIGRCLLVLDLESNWEALFQVVLSCKIPKTKALPGGKFKALSYKVMPRAQVG